MSAPALTKGLEILDYVATVNKAGFNEIKKELDIGASSLNRYLKVLLEKGYLIKNDTQTYSLGSHLYTIVDRKQTYNEFASLVYPALYTISNKTGFSSICLQFVAGKILCINKYVYPEGLTLQNIAEERTDYVYQPWGYLYLASLKDKVRSYYMDKSMDGTRHVVSEDLQMSYLKTARESGYVDDYGQLYAHIRRLAVPIYKEGVLVAAIGIGGIYENMRDEDVAHYIHLMKEEVDQLQKVL